MDFVLKKVFKSILKNILKPYLLEDLAIEQLAQVEGSFRLNDLKLKPEAFHKFLPSNLHVISGLLSISIDIPLVLSERKLRVCLLDIEFILGKGGKCDDFDINAMDDIDENDETINFEEEIEKNFKDSIYSMGNVKSAAKEIDQMIHEIELDISNLSIQLRSYSNLKQKDIALVLQIPHIQISHIQQPNDGSIGSLMKAISLPQDFKLFLYEFGENYSKGIKTLIADGPAFHSNNIADLSTSSHIRVKISNLPSSVQIKLDVFLKAFRVALNPLTLETVLESLDFIDFLSHINKHNNELTQDMDITYEDEKEEIKNDTNSDNNDNDNDDDDGYFSPNEFVDAPTFDDESSEELIFQDCIDVDETMFQSFLIQPPEIDQKVTNFDISLSIQQATITFLPTSDPITAENVFRGYFDINELKVPPYTPCNHTTFYFSNLSASITQFVNVTKCDFVLPICGITQYNLTNNNISIIKPNDIENEHTRWWENNDFISTNILSFNSNTLSLDNDDNNTQIPPISLTFKSTDKAYAVLSELEVILGEISLTIDDQLYHNIVPYIDIILKFLGNSNNNNKITTPIIPDTLDNIYEEYETEIEQLNSSMKILVKAEEISLRLQSSNPLSKEGILFNICELDIESTSNSSTNDQEWIILFSKITGALDKGSLNGYSNIDTFFNSNKHFSRVDSVVPIRITLKQPKIDNNKKNESIDNEDKTETKTEIKMMEDYESKPNIFDLVFEEEELPIPLSINNKVFEGKKKNPKISESNILDEFIFNSKTQSSISVVIQLPNSSIDLTKETYDTIILILSEFLTNFSNTNNSNSKKDIKNQSSSSNNPSICCDLILSEGTIVLRENAIELQNSTEEETMSSFHGSFKNFSSFFVSNYDFKNTSYFYSSIESYELRDCAPYHKEPLQLIQKPKYSVIYNTNKMFSTVIEMKNDSLLTLIELADTSVQYKLGANWIDRLQSFFIPQLQTSENNNKKEANNNIDNSKMEILCNMSNITVDYLPYLTTTQSAGIFYIKKDTEAKITPYLTASKLIDIDFRGKAGLYIIDDINKIVDLSEKMKEETIERGQYINRLGFRCIGDFKLLQVNIEMFTDNSPLKITLENNNTTFHLCKDSYIEILQLYSDFSFFGAKDTIEDKDNDNENNDNEEDNENINTNINNDFEESVFIKPLSEDSTRSTIIYDRSQMIQIGEEPLENYKKNINENIIIEEKNEPIDDIKDINANQKHNSQNTSPSKRINPFDGQLDTSFDTNIKTTKKETNPATAFNIPEYLNLDKDKKYMICGVSDINLIPTNAIQIPNTLDNTNNKKEEKKTEKKEEEEDYMNNIDIEIDDIDIDIDIGSFGTHSDDKVEQLIEKENIIEQKEEKIEQNNDKKEENIQENPGTFFANLEKESTQNTVKSNNPFITFTPPSSTDDIIGDFLVVKKSKDKDPIVRIRQNIVNSIDDSLNEDFLPPMLGVKIHHSYEKRTKIENLLSLPETYPKASMFISLINFNLDIIVYDGYHWSSSRESTKSEKNQIEICLRDMNVSFYTFNIEEQLKFRLGIEIRDIEIYDKLEVSNRNMVLCYDTYHLRSRDSSMINILMQQSNHISGIPHAMLNINILPLRLNIDQDARYFLTQFLNQDMPPSPKSQIHWEEISISDIDLQVDYKAKRFDRDILNLCSLSKAKFKLNGITQRNVTDFTCVITQAKEQWLSFIKGYALGLGPLSPIINLSAGFANLFYEPYAQYQKNGRLFRGVRQGITDFGVTLATESLNIGSKVASGSQMMLELTDDFINYTRPDSIKQALKDNESGRDIHPDSSTEGFQKAVQSVSRETSVAYKHLFVVPVEEYEKYGTGGAVNALVHALPIAVIRPMIGIAEGAKQVGIGTRNQIEPKQNQTKIIYKK